MRLSLKNQTLPKDVQVRMYIIVNIAHGNDLMYFSDFPGGQISTPKLRTSPNKKSSPKSPTRTKAPVTSESPIKIENTSSDGDFDLCSDITTSPMFIKAESDAEEGIQSEIIPHGIDPLAYRPKRKSRILAEEFLRKTISKVEGPKKKTKFEAKEESGESEYS